jgi:hypothetical protein
MQLNIPELSDFDASMKLIKFVNQQNFDLIEKIPPLIIRCSKKIRKLQELLIIIN